MDGVIVALDEAAPCTCAANEAGGMLWRALAGGATLGSSRPAPGPVRHGRGSRSEADADAFVAALRERGLLEG